MRLDELTVTDVKMTPARSGGVEWTATLRHGDVAICYVSDDGRGGTLKYRPLTMTNREWYPILQDLETQAKALLPSWAQDALYALISAAQTGESLSDPVIVRRIHAYTH